ncbi:pentapeptide repeat-containing protein [Nostoc sp. WHI]|uniref:pentapeptide repeat-containing protein n=1 Tax=Nostoc sp. WHI TaxID=2650611 RepID=UPI0018C830C1|nr:pentapeptide repeat-containing protein [Nostoc sp. WHI]
MGEDFAYLELRGICLSDFDLTNANFEGTDLSDANLRGANLENAKLVSTKLDGADLSNTKLTGICIQNWQVTDTTKFEGVDCKYIYLIPENQINDFRRELKLEELENIDKFFKELLISSEEKKKIKELIEQFDIIDLIGDKVIREYRLTQAVKSAKDSYGIEEDRFHQMFEDYRKQKLQAKRQSSWWQNFLWFKVEPSIEKLNILTKEMDIFPLLEQIGRLSILIAVIAYINDALQPPKLNLEEQYRSWEILQSDNDKVRGISRFALEQLRDKGNTLKKIQVSSGIDLSGINLSNADLTSASLNGVKLQGANLSKAKLQDADLRGADLKEASLGYLSSSDQNKSQGFNNILKRVLPNLPLPSVLNLGADLRNAKLQKANLTDADLQGANLTKATLTKTDLQGANLKKSNLSYSDLSYSDLTSADLTGADLQVTNLTEADLQGANLKKTNLSYSDLTSANLSEADLSETHLTGAKYSKATKFTKEFKPQDKGMVEIK